MIDDDRHPSLRKLRYNCPEVGCDRKTVGEFLEVGHEAPVHKLRQRRAHAVEPYELNLGRMR